jgi:hypothetical protein
VAYPLSNLSCPCLGDSSSSGDEVVDDKAESGDEDFVFLISTFSLIANCPIPDYSFLSRIREVRFLRFQLATISGTIQM